MQTGLDTLFLQALLVALLLLSFSRLDAAFARPRRHISHRFQPGTDFAGRPFSDPDGHPWPRARPGSTIAVPGKKWRVPHI